MRPLRLDLAGFTVFREPTTVDFTDVDFFALVGPTGSGKSTLLDAVCFALYGIVPRWSDKRGIANVLAPSGTEARVRLVFDSAGRRYAVTRVVRRDGKGRVATSHAGLEVLPAGFDPSTLDSGQEELGEVLAGTPSELDAAIVEVVGLPYEQFTTCVLLPQGSFAEFLHAKPAVRQQILVNLLGLSVYERIREAATDAQRQAETQVAALDQVLGNLADVTPEAIAAAQVRVDTMRRLAADVEAALPALRSAELARDAAVLALADLEAELARLDAVRVPADLSTLTAAATAARAEADAAEAAVAETEAADDRARADLAAAGDAATLRRTLDEHAERERLDGEATELVALVEEATAEHEKAGTELDEAAGAAVLARAAVDRARAAHEAAVTADRAASLRPHLVVGQPCPVCEQPVATLPGKHSPEMAAAKRALDAAERAAERADRAVAEQESVVRTLDRALVAARTRAEALQSRRTALAARLAQASPVDELRGALERIAACQRAAEAAGAAVRAGRDRARRAQAEAGKAEQRVRAAWRDFDTVRDAVAPLSPPPVDRDDLAASWHALAGWAGAQSAERLGRREVLAGRLAAAGAATDTAIATITALFTAAGEAPPTLGARDATRPGATRPAATRSGGARAGGPVGAGEHGAEQDAAAAGRAATVAVERARAALERLLDRRDQAEKLVEQRAGAEREAQVARTLAGHLRANNFERWLLEEALDLLVAGGSRILRELSGGQYELEHSGGEFHVVDHHDAGLRRGVRTLSGGETFQASLALALALAEQLSGMSGAASLESILLDEGFGTLDAATLDSVAATLENLAARGDRMVGVVTHVPALAERIPVRFEIHKDARTARVQRVGA